MLLLTTVLGPPTCNQDRATMLFPWFDERAHSMASPAVDHHRQRVEGMSPAGYTLYMLGHAGNMGHMQQS